MEKVTLGRTGELVSRLCLGCIIPILGFSRKEQYLEDIAALGVKLSDEHMAMLSALD